MLNCLKEKQTNNIEKILTTELKMEKNKLKTVLVCFRFLLKGQYKKTILKKYK